MHIKQFVKNTNLILITHGFGKQTQFIESLLDGHSKIVQFPTNYKDYFLNLKSDNYEDAIHEFIYLNPGYVYDIFNVHNNKYLIINKSRVVPIIEDRDYFYFDKKSLNKIKKDKKLKVFYGYIKKNLYRKYKKKYFLKEEINKIFNQNKSIDDLFLKANPVYSLDSIKFKKIYLNEINNKKFDLEFNKKNLLLVLHYCLSKYFRKDTRNLRYILFNLHDYTNTEQLINDFENCYHIAVAQDFKTRFSRNKYKTGTHHESVIQFCYANLNNINKMLNCFENRNNKNYLFFNEYVDRKKEKFVDKLFQILNINKEQICYRPTFMSKKSFGNSRNNKLLSNFSTDFKYNDWWNYLNKNEIFYLDYFFRSFFKVFKNKPSKYYQKKNIFLIYINIFKLFFINDYKYFIISESKTQKQFKKSSLKYFSYYRNFRTPIKIIIYTILYPIIFCYKIIKIEYTNIRYKNKRIKFNRYN